MESFCAAEEANKERARGSENEGSKRRARFEAASGKRAANRGLCGMLTLSFFVRTYLGRSRNMERHGEQIETVLYCSLPIWDTGPLFPKKGPDAPSKRGQPALQEMLEGVKARQAAFNLWGKHDR